MAFWQPATRTRQLHDTFINLPCSLSQRQADVAKGPRLRYLCHRESWTRIGWLTGDIVVPAESVNLFDFRLGDRAFRLEVKVFERGTRGKLGGLDANTRSCWQQSGRLIRW